MRVVADLRYYILLVLFLLSRAFASKQKFVELSLYEGFSQLI